jgi:hypothetical protein
MSVGTATTWASAVARSAATAGSGVLAADRRRNRRRDRRAAADQRFYGALISASVLLNDIKSTLPYYRRPPTSLWPTRGCTEPWTEAA